MSRAVNPRQRNTLPGQIAVALYRISQAVGRILRERGKQAGLSPAQVESLLFLKHARPQARTIGGLAERLGVSYATSSGVADALENKRLVRRAPLPDDQRVVSLRLTSEGTTQADRLEDLLDEIESAIDSLPDKDQAALRRATQAIVYRLQQAGYVKVYEMCWNCQFFRKNAHPDDPAGRHHCAFMDAPLPEEDTCFECPDFQPADVVGN